MLSLDRCRVLLGAVERSRSNAELEAMRDHLYTFARFAVAAYFRAEGEGAEESGGIGESRHFVSALSMFPDKDREELRERAAILEFEGRIGRDQAERRAVRDLLEGQRRSRT